MTSYHPLLRFGDIDAALLQSSDKAGRPVTVCIYKSTVLQNKDRVACQVFDGGTAYDYPSESTAFGVRLVMRAQAIDLTQIKDGLIIKLAPDTVIHTLKSGEKVFDCYDCEIMDQWQTMKQCITNVVNNPLSKPGAPPAPVYQPPQQHNATALAPAARDSVNAGSDKTPQLYQEKEAPQPPAVRAAAAKPTAAPVSSSSDTYGPERTTRAQHAKSEPYAAVKQKSTQNKYLKISDLTSYVDKWRILARVTTRSEIREYRNARGDGKLFSVDLIDADGVEIKGTFFNDAVDRFSPMIKKNGVYSFARGQIKNANPRFKKFDHPCELTFGLDAEITEEDSGSSLTSTQAIPLAKLNAKSLAEADASDVDTLLDIVCLCYQVYDTSQITIKATGARKDKRTVQVIDQSGVIIPLTLWGTDCSLLPPGSWSNKQTSSNGSDNPMAEYYLVVKKAKVDDFNGKKLSSSMGLVQIYIWNEGHWYGSIEDSENMQQSMIPPEVIDLKEWVATSKASPQGLQGTRGSGSTPGAASMAKHYHNIADMLVECQTMSSDQLSSGAYFNIVATVVESNITPHRKFFWAACPSCGKKLQGGPDGAADSFGAGNMNVPYTCAQCDLTVESPDRKYNFTLDIQDYTNTVKISVLGDQGKDLFNGMSANDLENLKMHRGPEGQEFQDVVQGLRRQEFLFKVVARNETWQDETRIKYRVQSVQQLHDEGLVSYLQKQKTVIDSLLT